MLVLVILFGLYLLLGVFPSVGERPPRYFTRAAASRILETFRRLGSL